MHKGTAKLSVLSAMWAVSACFLLAAFTVYYTVGEERTGRLMYHGQVCTAGIGKNAVDIYSLTGEKICGYKTENGDNKIFSSCISDIDYDGTDEILLITGQDKNQYGSCLEILKPEFALEAGGNKAGEDRADEDRTDDSDSILPGSADLKRIYRFDMKEINPWKIQTCDVDGDGSKEISAGVYKATIFHPVMAKRPFIYNWTDGHLSPKWLGSRLARPFDDYIFCDVNSDGRDELVSTELLADGSRAVNVYAWKGFGFESIGGSASYEDILEIRNATGQAIEINAVMNGHSEWTTIRYENETLVNSK